MTTHDYKTIANIVGADKIDALRDAGVDIADKPNKPTTDLLGRWAKHPTFKDVLVASRYADELNMVSIAYVADNWPGGAMYNTVELQELTFPEQTTRPEDVSEGEAWLVNVDDGDSKGKGIPAVKIDKNDWATGDVDAMRWWEDCEVTLIAPLIPARPLDADRERAYWEQQVQIDQYERDAEPETVKTVKEYEALPAGSIVAFTGGNPWLKDSDGAWRDGNSSLTSIAYTPRQVLRRGWGE